MIELIVSLWDCIKQIAKPIIPIYVFDSKKKRFRSIYSYKRTYIIRINVY